MIMRTRLCGVLGIEYPIIQAGMGIDHPAYPLVAAVSNAGALGSLGATGRSPSELGEQIALIRQRTRRPFAVNFLVSNFNEGAFCAALEAGPAVISFALGDPGDLIRRAHAAGAIVVQQIHTVAQARQAAERGVDVMIAQGGEAGGYGQFVGTLPLLPQVVDAVRPLPVVAAGGIADGRGIAAALLLGADGVNMGTRFLASTEAPIADGWKKAIIAAQSEDAVKVEFWNVISASSSGLAGYGSVPRALRTPFYDRWAPRQAEAVQKAQELRHELEAAVAEGRFHEYMPYAGQSAGLIRDVLPVREIIRRLITEAEETLKRAPTLAATLGGRRKSVTSRRAVTRSRQRPRRARSANGRRTQE
jgi:nitronate monooxygenase/enoyl-[acyl-carrier protein] reductase II